MIEIRLSEAFDEWLSHLDDRIVKARIIARLKSARFGNLGDIRSIGDGVSEMRVHAGAGYRLYFTRTRVIVLLCAGEKSSQHRDIVREKACQATSTEDRR